MSAIPVVHDRQEVNLPEEAFAAALEALPRMTAHSLVRLLTNHRPSEAWSQIAAGRLPVWATKRAADWVRTARDLDVASLWEQYRSAGVLLHWYGGPGYPPALAEDPDPPGALFVRSATDCFASALGNRRVAIVGTRASTGYGNRVASDMAAGLAAEGVSVVSGLANGIDTAAHRGAISAGGGPPIGVVGCGLDSVYPQKAAGTWARVAEHGALVSEYALGSPPHHWHFPVRNRIIAALAHVVVIVESDVNGGAMHTVDAALARNVEVMAVPGPVTSRVSRGTNTLIHAGALMARDAADVLTQLSLVTSRTGCEWSTMGPSGRRLSIRNLHQDHEKRYSGGDENRITQLPPLQRQVLNAVDTSPTTTAQVIEYCPSITIGEIVEALGCLEEAGLVRAGAGWWERR